MDPRSADEAAAFAASFSAAAWFRRSANHETSLMPIQTGVKRT
jgi:hypothetical protein